MCSLGRHRPPEALPRVRAVGSACCEAGGPHFCLPPLSFFPGVAHPLWKPEVGPATAGRVSESPEVLWFTAKMGKLRPRRVMEGGAKLAGPGTLSLHLHQPLSNLGRRWAGSRWDTRDPPFLPCPQGAQVWGLCLQRDPDMGQGWAAPDPLVPVSKGGLPPPSWPSLRPRTCLASSDVSPCRPLIAGGGTCSPSTLSPLLAAFPCHCWLTRHPSRPADWLLLGSVVSHLTEA